jgi:MFS family permease
LIVLRIVQGFGAAMFITTGMAILSAVFAPERRGRAIGLYVAAVYIGLSAGPFAGGFLIQHAGWRTIFILMLPLGVASTWVTLHFLKGEWAEKRDLPFDLIGSLLYAFAICALVYGATGLPVPRAWALVAIGVVGIVLFVWREKRAADPIFDIALFQYNRTFAFSSLAALINYAATYAVTFLLSLFLQYIKGLPAQTTGMVLVAQPIVMALFSPLAGRLADRVEPRWIASLGMLITGIGLAGLIFLTAETGMVYIVCNLVLLGFGFAFFSSPNMSAIMGSVEPRHFGIASGTVATMRLLGQMVSMATAAVVLALFIGRAPIGPANYPLFVKSAQLVFFIFLMICIPGVYFSLSRGALRR